MMASVSQVDSVLVFDIVLRAVDDPAHASLEEDFFHPCM